MSYPVFIAIINMVIPVSSYIYFNKKKGYIYKEICELKNDIRKEYKKRIQDYAYDNIFR